MTDDPHDIAQPDVEFFGITLKVPNPHLATLLNSGDGENVVVLGRRTAELLARADGEEGLDLLEGTGPEADGS